MSHETPIEPTRPSLLLRSLTPQTSRELRRSRASRIGTGGFVIILTVLRIFDGRIASRPAFQNTICRLPMRLLTGVPLMETSSFDVSEGSNTTVRVGGTE